MTSYTERTGTRILKCAFILILIALGITLNIFAPHVFDLVLGEALDIVATTAGI